MKGDCSLPITGCAASSDKQWSGQCDTDALLDHVCYNTVHDDIKMVLSSEDCPKTWGNNDRSEDQCSNAFDGIKLLSK